MRRVASLLVGLGFLVVGPARATAQTAPAPAGTAPAAAPTAAPPQPAAAGAYPYGYPPPGYPQGYPQGYPPPGYPPPGYPPYGYGYAPYPYYPPAAPAPPATRPYTEGQPVPEGYHVEEQNKHGLVIAGLIVWSVPYVTGFSVVAGEGFPNKTGFLVLPVLGPWITLAARHKTCPDVTASDFISVHCSDDDEARSLLVFDGLSQATGAALLIAGLASTTKRLVRNEARVFVAPARVGSGYGLSALGRF